MKDYVNPEISLQEKEKGNEFFKKNLYPEAVKGIYLPMCMCYACVCRDSRGDKERGRTREEMLYDGDRHGCPLYDDSLLIRKS